MSVDSYSVLGMSPAARDSKETKPSKTAKPAKAVKAAKNAKSVRVPVEAGLVDPDILKQLVRQAREEGSPITGPDGLLKQLTKIVVEAALEEEISEHLGYTKGDIQGRNGGNSRNGKRTKTLTTASNGEIAIQVPRDRDSTFSPVIVPKHTRRLTDLDEVVLSLSAKGLTHGEIASHFSEIYGARVSEDTISRITDRVIDEMNSWLSRPLDSVYVAVFIDAIMVKVL